jgi:glycosyltransferase involved in cell wall biosynthesis
MLRVLLVADSLDVGGAERHVLALATALQDSGHQPTIAAACSGGLAETVIQHGIRLEPLLGHLVKRRLSLEYAAALAKLIRREPFEVLHTHMYASNVAAGLANLGHGIPHVITEHSEAAWRTRSDRIWSRLAYARAARIVSVSDAIRRRLIEIDRLPGSRIEVIRNALPTFSRLGTETEPPLAKAPGETWIGVVARLQPEKGVADFMYAASLIASRREDVRFLIAGDGPDRQELDALAARLGVQHQVRFLGYRTDVPQLLQVLDMLVVPSLSEGTPLVVLEAMQAGVPIVATRAGGIPEQVRHDQEALLVHVGQSDALAVAVLRLLDAPALARRLCDAACFRVATVFDHATMVRRTIAVYEQALRSPHRRLAPQLKY